MTQQHQGSALTNKTALANRQHPLKAIAQVVLTLLAFTFLLPGCATRMDKLDHLNQTLLTYERSIRWAQFDAAYAFHVWENDERPDFPPQLANIKVTAYEVINRKFDADTMTTRQTVMIRYYNTETSREKTLRMEQDWQFYPETKRWMMLSPPPAFE